MTSYKLHLFQHLKDTDKPEREDFCTQVQAMSEQHGFDDHLVFSDEATFYLLIGKVNKHNTGIWGTEHHNLILEHVRDSSKVNVFYAISKKGVHRPYFFIGRTVNSEAHLAMLQN